MIACLKKDLLKQNIRVQKNVKLDKVLNDLKYFDTREEAYKEDYVPVCFVTAVRTAYSNLVVEHEVDHLGQRNYVSLNLSQVLPHKGYDLMMFMSSLAVAKMIDCTKPENQRLMFSSQFSPIGVYNPDPGICDPVIYSHIVINDDKVEDLRASLLPGNKLVSIQDMNTKGNLKELLNELIIVKEESSMPHIPGKHEVIDVTFKGGRKQSDILKEVDLPVEQENEPTPPASLTSEQLENYCIQCIASTGDQQKRRVFAKLIQVIKEHEEMKKELRAYKLKELRDSNIEETPDDIQE